MVSLVMPDETDAFQHLADDQLDKVFANSDEALKCALGNLTKLVMDTGITIERFDIENIDLSVWSFEFRRGTHLPFVASLLLLGFPLTPAASSSSTNGGELATAYHVVSDSDGNIRIRLRNGSTYKATIVAVDKASDTALLQAEPEMF